jgi:hypothetical protein
MLGSILFLLRLFRANPLAPLPRVLAKGIAGFISGELVLVAVSVASILL